jgi:competence protein ComEC
MIHAFAFTLGIVLLQQFQQLLDLFWLAPLGLSALFLFRLNSRVLVWFVLGFGWALLSAQLNMQDKLDEAIEGNDIQVVGSVASIPEPFDFGTRFLFNVDSVEAGVDPKSIPNKIRLGWYQDYPELRVGQKWTLLVRLKKPHGTLNPSGFDYEGWLFEKKIRATGYVRRSSENRLLGEERGMLISFGRLRQQLGEQIDLALANSQVTGVVKALAIGSRKEITPAQWELFRKTGTSHLVAISGLHIGLVAGLIFFAVRWLSSRIGIIRFAPYQVAASVSIFTAVCYAALADFALPTQRALLMVLVVMLSVIWRRERSSLNLLSVALITVLVFDPFAVNSASFWLSFGAVSLIVYLSAGRVARERSLIKKQKIHIILAIGLVPILLLYFQQFSVIAPLANLVAIPLVGLVVVPVVLLALLFLCIAPSLSHLALELASSCLDGLVFFLSRLSDLPVADWVSAAPSGGVACLAMVGVFVLFAPKGFPARWLAGLLFLPVIFVRQPVIEKGDFKATLLDVGQGLSVVVQTAEHLLLFDTGVRFGRRFDIGTMVVVPYVRSIGLSKVDKLIVSHGDLDHRGGAQAIVKQLVVDELLTSAPEKFGWTESNRCEEGQNWQWDGVLFRFLNPLKEGSGSENNRSCVLQVSSPAGALLLTGDIEKETEKRLVKKYGQDLMSDVLVVPHHGSKSSSSVNFIDAVNPAYALFPLGYRNRFNFPADEVVMRYQKRSVRLLDTSSHGAITVYFKRQSRVLNVESFRMKASHYWNR